LRADSLRLCAAAGLAVLLGTSLPATRAAAQTPATSDGRPSASDVAGAIEKLRADPNLAENGKIHVLQWRQPTRGTMPGWLKWIVGLFRWLAQSARALVWMTVALLAGLLVVFIIRMIRARGRAEAAGRLLTPTHVQNLDIRPESLPDDIGAAARALWDRNERRAALALLYRGLLSRLAHVHAVPIRASTTEGACLTLAAAHLTDARHAYVSWLVRVWQRSVYGGQEADTTTVHALCSGFAPALDPSPAAAAQTSA
jgi:hypothetical protein